MSKQTQSENNYSEKIPESNSKIKSKDRDWNSGGLFLIVLGAYLLLANLGYIEWLSILDLFKYWPLLLVFWGLELLIKNEFVWKLIKFLFTLLIIAWLATLLLGIEPKELVENQFKISLPRFWQTQTRQKQSSLYKLDNQVFAGIETRILNLNLSMGEILLEDSSANFGFEVASQHWEAFGEPQITEVIEDSNLELNMAVKEKANSWPGFDPSKIVPSYVITYGSPEVITDLNFNLKLGSAVIKLDNVAHQNINLNNDLGSMELALGESALPKQLNLKTGMGSITILLPSELSLNLDYKVGIGSLNVDGESLLGEGNYQTEATPDQPELKIQAEVGVGSIHIVRGSN